MIDKPKKKRPWYNGPYGCGALVIVIVFGVALIDGTFGLETVLTALVGAAVVVLVVGLYFWVLGRVIRLWKKRKRNTPTDR